MIKEEVIMQEYKDYEKSIYSYNEMVKKSKIFMQINTVSYEEYKQKYLESILILEREKNDKKL